MPDGLGSRAYNDLAAALRRAAAALESRGHDAELAEQAAASLHDRGLLALAPAQLDAIMAREGCDLAAAARTLAADWRWRFTADTLAFNWEVARDRARRQAKRDRARLVLELAAQGLGNAAIARHPEILATTGGVPLHPASVSRILQRGLKQKIARTFPILRPRPPELPGRDFPKPVRRLFLSMAAEPASPPHRPHTPAPGPARVPAIPQAGRGPFSSRGQPAATTRPAEAAPGQNWGEEVIYEQKMSAAGPRD